MSDQNIQQKAVDIMTLMSVAITNIRFYPPTSTIIRNTLSRVYQLFHDIFKEEASVIFAESGKNYIVCGLFFGEQKATKYPQAVEFLELLSRFNIRSVAFENKLTKPELKTFLEIISQKPENVEKDGGLKALLATKKLENIIVDHKVYVVVDREQEIVATLDTSDEKLARYLSGEGSLPESALQEIQLMAKKDPHWVNQIFRVGMGHIMGQRNTRSYEKLSDLVGHMIRLIDKITDKTHQEEIALELAQNISEMEDDALMMIFSQEISGSFSEKLFDNVIQTLDDQKFKRIISQLEPPKSDSEKNQSFASRFYKDIQKSGREQQFKQRIKQHVNLAKTRRGKRKVRLVTGINSILKGEKKYISDKVIMDALPSYILQLQNSETEETASALMERLCHWLSDPSVQIRNQVAETLSRIGRMLIEEGFAHSLIPLMPCWLNWVRTEETTFNHSYQSICFQLQELGSKLLTGVQIKTSLPVLETFSQLHRDQNPKKEPVASMAGQMLGLMASNDVLDLLLAEIQHSNVSRRRNAAFAFKYLGVFAVPRLLDVLQKSRDMSERNRIIQVINEIGAPAVPRLKEKMEEGGAWYYLRNLVLIMGKIGGEEHLDVIRPLLRHPDFRVQREALNSIYTIGGRHRGPILTSALEFSDDRMKIYIVDMLGALKYSPAVKLLVKMLESKTFFQTRITGKLKEKICYALGRIGSKRAIPALTHMTTPKTLLSLKGHSEKVRIAAEKALSDIKNTENYSEFSASDLETAAGREHNLPAGGQPTEPDEKAPVASGAETGPAPSVQNSGPLDETALQALFQSIVQAVENKDFEKAEALRHQLIDNFETAFTEINRSGEIIEEARREHSGIEQDHLSLWADLYDALTPEEADALYDAVSEMEVETDREVFVQGERNQRLWFVRQGRLKIVCRQGDRVSLIKTVGRESIVGEDTFFSPTLCTTSLVALSPVKLFYLDRETLDKWEKTFPAIESKLHNYCLQLERIEDILKEKGIDRRTQERITIVGVLSLELLSLSGRRTGQHFRGNLVDISLGGISFLILSPDQKKIWQLLGRKLILTFGFSQRLGKRMGIHSGEITDEKIFPVLHSGTVIGVSHREGNEFKVHIKFDRLLGDAVAKAVKK